jgi:hypothetical protein
MRSIVAVALGAILGCSGARRGPAACDLQSGPCTLPAGPDVLVTLDVSPRPIRALAELTFTVEARRGADPAAGAAEISLQMPGMFMGENRLALAAVGPGRHRGKGTVVRCGSGRRDWVAEVRLSPPGAPPLRATFPFTVAE